MPRWLSVARLREDLAHARDRRRVALSPGTYAWLRGAIVLTLTVAGLLLATQSGSHRTAFATINALGNPLPDWALANLTEFGNTAVLAALLVVGARRQPQLLVALVIAILGGALIINGLKSAFAVPRPPAVLDASSFRLVGKAHLRGSFPSGHTFATFSAAAIAIGFCRAWSARVAILIAAALVGLGRVLVGVHWPLDVAVGAAGGLATGAWALWLSSRWRGAYHPAVHLGMLWLVIASNIVLVLDGTNYRQADLLMGLIAAVSTAAVAWQYLIAKAVKAP